MADQERKQLIIALAEAEEAARQMNARRARKSNIDSSIENEAIASAIAAAKASARADEEARLERIEKEKRRAELEEAEADAKKRADRAARAERAAEQAREKERRRLAECKTTKRIDQNPVKRSKAPLGSRSAENAPMPPQGWPTQWPAAWPTQVLRRQIEAEPLSSHVSSDETDSDEQPRPRASLPPAASAAPTKSQSTFSNNSEFEWGTAAAQQQQQIFERQQQQQIFERQQQQQIFERQQQQQIFERQQEALRQLQLRRSEQQQRLASTQEAGEAWGEVARRGAAAAAVLDAERAKRERAMEQAAARQRAVDQAAAEQAERTARQAREEAARLVELERQAKAARAAAEARAEVAAKEAAAVRALLKAREEQEAAERERVAAARRRAEEEAALLREQERVRLAAIAERDRAIAAERAAARVAAERERERLLAVERERAAEAKRREDEMAAAVAARRKAEEVAAAEAAALAADLAAVQKRIAEELAEAEAAAAKERAEAARRRAKVVAAAEAAALAKDLEAVKKMEDDSRAAAEAEAEQERFAVKRRLAEEEATALAADLEAVRRMEDKARREFVPSDAWTCAACTFVNQSHAATCDVCGSAQECPVTAPAPNPTAAATAPRVQEFGCAHKGCAFDRHRNPPSHFKAEDKTYCCSRCRISIGRDHGGHCEKRTRQHVSSSASQSATRSEVVPAPVEEEAQLRQQIHAFEAIILSGEWECLCCTFAGNHEDRGTCELCGASRGALIEMSCLVSGKASSVESSSEVESSRCSVSDSKKASKAASTKEAVGSTSKMDDILEFLGVSAASSKCLHDEEFDTECLFDASYEVLVGIGCSSHDSKQITTWVAKNPKRK